MSVISEDPRLYSRHVVTLRCSGQANPWEWTGMVSLLTPLFLSSSTGAAENVCGFKRGARACGVNMSAMIGLFRAICATLERSCSSSCSEHGVFTATELPRFPRGDVTRPCFTKPPGVGKAAPARVRSNISRKNLPALLLPPLLPPSLTVPSPPIPLQGRPGTPPPPFAPPD